MSEVLSVLVGLAAGFVLGGIYGGKAWAAVVEKFGSVLEKLNFLK